MKTLFYYKFKQSEKYNSNKFCVLIDFINIIPFTILHPIFFIYRLKFLHTN